MMRSLRLAVPIAPLASSAPAAQSQQTPAAPAAGTDFQRDEHSPEQIDSWNRVWTFFDWNLRPYEDRSKPPPSPTKVPSP